MRLLPLNLPLILLLNRGFDLIGNFGVMFILIHHLLRLNFLPLFFLLLQLLVLLLGDLLLVVQLFLQLFLRFVLLLLQHVDDPLQLLDLRQTFPHEHLVVVLHVLDDLLVLIHLLHALLLKRLLVLVQPHLHSLRLVPRGLVLLDLRGNFLVALHLLLAQPLLVRLKLLLQFQQLVVGLLDLRELLLRLFFLIVEVLLLLLELHEHLLVLVLCAVDFVLLVLLDQLLALFLGLLVLGQVVGDLDVRDHFADEVGVVLEVAQLGDVVARDGLPRPEDKGPVDLELVLAQLDVLDDGGREPPDDDPQLLDVVGELPEVGFDQVLQLED